MNRIRNIHPNNWALHDWFGWLTAIPALVAFYYLMVYEYTTVVVTSSATLADGTPVRWLEGVSAMERDGWPGFIAPSIIVAVLGLLWWLASRMENALVRFVGLIAAFLAGALAGKWLWDTVTKADFDAASFWRGFACFVVMFVLLIVNLLYYVECYEDAAP